MSIVKAGEKLNSTILADLSVLSADLERAITRAARWKEACRRLCAGMPSVFESYERSIDGKVSAQIETGGLYRCCVEGLRALIDSGNEDQGEFVCEHCNSRTVKTQNVWRAA